MCIYTLNTEYYLILSTFFLNINYMKMSTEEMKSPKTPLGTEQPRSTIHREEERLLEGVGEWRAPIMSSRKRVRSSPSLPSEILEEGVNSGMLDLLAEAIEVEKEVKEWTDNRKNISQRAVDWIQPRFTKILLVAKDMAMMYAKAEKKYLQEAVKSAAGDIKLVENLDNIKKSMA